MLGFNACGIEINEALADASRQLLADYQLECDIHCGSYFDTHIAWFGITEMFEESVLTLHWELGFDRIGAGIVDDRNKKRPGYLARKIENGEFGRRNMTISKAYYDEIEDLLSFDIVFYEMMKRRFRNYLAGFEMDQALGAYRESNI